MLATASLPQLLPSVSQKPPQLRLRGHERFWGWLKPVFRVSDEELVRTAGLDALIAVRGVQFELQATVGSHSWESTPCCVHSACCCHPLRLTLRPQPPQPVSHCLLPSNGGWCPQVRILSFGVMLFLPMTVLGLGVLLPVNYTSGGRRAAWLMRTSQPQL
jgi:hypothetical protein